jgi:hypothetical protein
MKAHRQDGNPFNTNRIFSVAGIRKLCYSSDISLARMVNLTKK